MKTMTTPQPFTRPVEELLNESLKLHLDTPTHLTGSFLLKEGAARLPTFRGDLELVSEASGQVVLSSAVRHKNQNETTPCDEAIARFEPRLRVLNPSVLEPTDTIFTWWNDFIDFFRDGLADILVQEVRVTEDGKVSVIGEVDFPWPFPNQRLERSIEAVESIRPTLMSVLGGRSTVGPNQNATARMLSGLTKIVGPGSFEMISRGETKLDAQGERTDSAKESILRGNIKVNPKGHYHIDVTSTADLHSDNALDLEFQANTKMNFQSDDRFIGDVDVRYRGDLAHTSLHGLKVDNLNLPLHLEGRDSLKFDGGFKGRLNQLGFKTGNGRLNLEFVNGLHGETVATGDHRDTRLDAAGGRLSTNIHLDYGINSDGFFIRDLDIDAAAALEDPRIISAGIAARLPFYGDFTVEGSDLTLDAKTQQLRGTATVKFHADPRDLPIGERQALPIDAEYVLHFEKSGLRVEAKRDALTEFLRPFTQLDGNEAALTTRVGGVVGSTRSKAFREKLEAITNAKIRTGNRTDLLLDGVESYPARMKLIDEARESLIMQTLIFKEDESGMATAEALVRAAKRGVDVRVVIDALGNLETLDHLIDGRPLYQYLRDNGVKLELYNHPSAQGLGSLVNALDQIDALSAVKSPDDLKDPSLLFSLLRDAAQVAFGPETMNSDAKADLIAWFDAHSSLPGETDEDVLLELPNGAVIAAAEAVTMGKMLVELNHRWHEKYLVADGRKAIVGGLNIADEYMFGGTDRKIMSLGTERPAWRDTDILIEGPAAHDVYSAFSRNWEHLTGDALDELTRPDGFEDGKDILMVQHRPRIDGDHHITNAMVETIKALRPGEKCWISSAYFIPTGALELWKDVLCDAAKRGVDVRILTNGGPSSDAPVINQAAIQSYRELADAGVIVMEKNGTQTIHSKTAVMGSHMSFVGSWNGDNRSASLNSEDVAIVFDDALAKEMEASFLEDSAPGSVTVVNDAWFAKLGWLDQLKSYGLSLFANLM